MSTTHSRHMPNGHTKAVEDGTVQWRTDVQWCTFPIFSIDKTLSLWKFIICCLIRALRICTRTVVNKDKQRRIQILKGCKIYDLRGNMWYWSKIWPHFNFDRLVCLVQVVQNTALGLSSFHDENHVSRTLLDTSLTGVDCNHCTGSNARGSLDCFENICATFSLM